MKTVADTAAGDLAAAIRARLPHDTRWQVRPAPDRGAVDLVFDAVTPRSLVAAAVTDDGHFGEVLTHAWWRACTTGATLRAVHVWTGLGARIAGVRVRPDQAASADLLLSLALYDALPPEAADAAEREVLHHRDPALALRALSKEAGLLVVAAGEHPTPDRPFGETVESLIGHTACPLTIVLPPVDGPPPGW